MKNIKYLIILVLFLPLVVFAKSNYDDSVSYAKNYSSSFSSYDKYIYSSKGTLISFQEYNRTINNNNNSYLLIDLPYWTSTEYVNINTMHVIGRNVTNLNKNETSGVRVCDYVKPNITVNGSGKQSDPWVFETIYKVVFTSKNEEFVKINDSDKIQYVKNNATANFATKYGYKYKNAICSKDVDLSNTKTSVTISNVNSDLICSVDYEREIYMLSVDLNGGTCDDCAKSDEVIFGSTINLGTPIKEDNTFIGWKVITGTGHLNSNNLTIDASDITVQAQWHKSTYTFDYKNSVQEFIIPISGTYKLEVWGAQGGNITNNNKTTYGGKGGYATGEKYFNKDDKLYIVTGGQGTNAYSTSTAGGGGYNGGGNAKGCVVTVVRNNNKQYSVDNAGTGGGGATHIATKSGLLKNLSSYKDSVLLVGAGGGGSYNFYLEGDHYYSNGGDGGGETGSSPDNVIRTCTPTGGTQTSSGTCDNHSSVRGGFGYGGNGSGSTSDSNSCYSGGGSGYYGGSGRWDQAASQSGGAGGSSYISTKLSNRTTASGEKEGNGYAKITLISVNN